MADIAYKDNSDRLRMEFADSRLNMWLRFVLWGLAFFLRSKYDITLVITCLWRSPEENAAAGGQPYSAHCDWRAADIRTWEFTPEIEAAIVKHLRRFWPEAMLHIKFHDSGAGRHLHLNINFAWLRTKAAKGEYV